ARCDNHRGWGLPPVRPRRRRLPSLPLPLPPRRWRDCAGPWLQPRCHPCCQNLACRQFLMLGSMELSPEEARVVGSLIEKQLTTPQQYPLTLNALVAACNQTSNRHPVVDYDEGAVQ